MKWVSRFKEWVKRNTCNHDQTALPSEVITCTCSGYDPVDYQRVFNNGDYGTLNDTGLEKNKHWQTLLNMRSEDPTVRACFDRWHADRISLTEMLLILSVLLQSQKEDLAKRLYLKTIREKPTL